MSHFAESIQRDLAAGRDPNHKASGSLAAVPGSRWGLFMRWHDRSRDQWEEWKEIRDRELWEKFGATVDEWKEHAKSWIEMGGTYEIKIVQITERIEWSIHYENVKGHVTPDRECGSQNQTEEKLP